MNSDKLIMTAFLLNLLVVLFVLTLYIVDSSSLKLSYWKNFLASF